MADDGTGNIRQLAHDLRNHLFVITLGLQALELERKPEQVAALLSQIRGEVAAAEKVADALQGVEADSPEA